MNDAGLPSMAATASSSMPPPSASTLNTLQILDLWKAFDLSGKRNALDAQAQEMADNQDAALNSRKKLAEDTRNYRKGTDEDKVKNMGPLLKGYQEEIDRLTKRSKFAETAYLAIYKSLSDIPDPVPVLLNLMSETQKSTKVAELESENRRLQKELGEFRKEFQEIKNQEVTIRRLEDKLKDYEGKLDEMVAEKLKESERSLKESAEKLTDEHLEKQHALANRVNHLQTELSLAHSASQSAQNHLLDMKSKYDEESHNRQIELDLLSGELERANTRVLTLEKQLLQQQQTDQIGKRDSAIGGSSSSLATSTGPDLELQLAQRDIELSRLSEMLQRGEAQWKSATEENHRTVKILNEKIEAERDRSLALQRELSSLPKPAEIEQMRRRLQILQVMEPQTASSLQDEGNVDESGGGVKSADETLEKHFRDRIRSLEADHTRLKVSLSERESELSELRQKLSAAESVSDERARLIRKLEDDLSRGSKPAAEVRDAAVENLLNKSSKEDGSMLQIVCSQRDRFRTRIQELESEASKLGIQLERQRTEMSSLRSDNVKLYEKIRYLQSYGDIAKNRPADIEALGHLDSKYKSLYEESVNPFNVFNKKEKDIRYAQLSAADKATLIGSRVLLANKYSRLFLFFYSIFLHLLVMFSMYKLALGNSYSYCGAKTLDAAAQSSSVTKK